MAGRLRRCSTRRSPRHTRVQLVRNGRPRCTHESSRTRESRHRLTDSDEPHTRPRSGSAASDTVQRRARTAQRTARARLEPNTNTALMAHGSDLSRQSVLRSPSSHAHTVQGPTRAGARRPRGVRIGEDRIPAQRLTPALRTHGPPRLAPPRLAPPRALPATLWLFAAHDAEFGAAPLTGHCSLIENRSTAG